VALRIGAAQGFSGDDLRGTREVVDDGVDYICCEALAEFTLTAMHRERQHDERAGYARDVGAVAEIALPAVAKGEARLITNAGALNPLGARQAVAEASGAVHGQRSGERPATAIVGERAREPRRTHGRPGQQPRGDSCLYPRVSVGSRHGTIAAQLP